jgi:hypothetical protein
MWKKTWPRRERLDFFNTSSFNLLRVACVLRSPIGVSVGTIIGGEADGGIDRCPPLSKVDATIGGALEVGEHTFAGNIVLMSGFVAMLGEEADNGGEIWLSVTLDPQ